ncbi:type I secretion system permease/ATPase [Spiribacter roseus]|uniref:Type I secretion system permease/ATPase n=1 Tax=Spiribacter roseus TaxID=1855875 RepID=A0ABV3RZE0_9GAMM
MRSDSSHNEVLRGEDFITCLRHVAEGMQAPVASQELDAIADSTPETLSRAEAKALLEQAGLEVSEGRRRLRSMRGSLLPVMLILEDGSTLIVSGRSEAGRWIVFDPAYGASRELSSLDCYEQDFSGALLLLSLRKPLRDVKKASGGEHWFWSAVAANRWLYGQVLLAAAVTNILGLSTALFIMVVYDRVVPNQAMESLLALTLGMVIALGFDFLIKTLRGAFIEKAGQNADIRMGRRIFDQLLDMQLSARQGSSGGFANTLREFETLRDFFASASVAALVDLPFIFLFIGVIYLIGGPLALVPLIAVPLVLIIGVAIQPLLGRIAEDSFQEGRSKQGILVEAISGLETIKAVGAGQLVRERWEEGIRSHSDVSRKGRAVQQFALNATGFAQQAAQVGIVVYGVFLIGDGTISMGAMIAAVILTGRTLAPLAQLAQTLTRVNQARTAYRALDRIMGLPREHPETREFLRRPFLSGHIKLKDVGFQYDGESPEVLSDLNIEIQPGERVAILGRVGSGKSTLARLMSGLYQPNRGNVLVDGTDIRQIDPTDLRNNTGMVLQDAWLFSGTVRENIALGDPLASDEKVLEAARLAGAHDFIATHPLGYGMPVGERGESLSGGQRQLICLARALLRAPPMLVFDEFTSAMDVQTEQKLLERLAEAVAGSTLVVITHRTNLLGLVDRVIVLDEGKVVSDGPKEALLRRNATEASN